MKIVSISIGANHGHDFDGAAIRLREEGYDVEVVGADSCDMDADVLFSRKILGDVRESGMVFIRL